jgi:hypothetical protein
MRQLLTIAFSVLLSVGHAQTAGKYPDLKAVLVVGHLEGDGTANAIRSMNRIADLLREKGVKTYCFYDTEAQWAKIEAAAKGAHFFLYNGHGRAGGGLAIESGGTSGDIESLGLAANAVVGFQSVCFGAGSSASDDEEIDIAEAVKRVGWYAQPFLNSGAGCYYASNWNDGILQFLQRLFDGETSKACFAYCKVDTIMPFSSDRTKELGLCSVNFGGTVTRTSYRNGVKTVREVPSHRNFEVAWVGNPLLTMQHIIK